MSDVAAFRKMAKEAIFEEVHAEDIDGTLDAILSLCGLGELVEAALTYQAAVDQRPRINTTDALCEMIPVMLAFARRVRTG